MTTIAFVPARAGSKGIPNKCLRLLDGKPLVTYTLHAALLSDVDQVVISSDSDAIHQVAEEYASSLLSAKAPLLHHYRHELISHDRASMLSVVDDYLNQQTCTGTDVLLLLQPTSPIRRIADINAVTIAMKNQSLSSMVAVCEAMQHPNEMVRFVDKKMKFFIDNDALSNRQAYQQAYYINGSMYAVTVDFIRRERRFFNEDSQPFIMPQLYSIDIDSMDEFIMAEAVIKTQHTYV